MAIFLRTYHDLEYVRAGCFKFSGNGAGKNKAGKETPGRQSAGSSEKEGNDMEKFLYRVLILTVMVFAFAAPVLADPGETPEIKVYETKRHLNPDADEFVFALDTYELEAFYIKTITVKGADGKMIQKIETADFNDGDDASSYNLDPNEQILFEDLNFDGWDDMRIVPYVGAGANIPYIVWLWDTGKKQFVHDEALSALVNIRADNDAKTIKSGGRYSAAEYGEDDYKYIDGKLTLFKSVVWTYLDGEDEGMVEEVTSELKNGEMTETGRVKKKAEE
jgi:hypothetical protein